MADQEEELPAADEIEVPDGQIGIVLDIRNNDNTLKPWCVLIAAGEIPDFIQPMSFAGKLPFRKAVSCLGREFVEAYKRPDPEPRLMTCARVAMWLALKDPQHGPIISRQVSACFRQHNRVMITWFMHPRFGFGATVGLHYTDMAEAVEGFSRDGVTEPIVLEVPIKEPPLS